MEASNFCNASLLINTLVKLRNYGKAHEAQIFRAKENMELSHGGPSQRHNQAQTNRLKLWERDTIMVCDITLTFPSNGFYTAIYSLPMVLKDENINNYKCNIYKQHNVLKMKLKCTYTLICLWEKKDFNCASNVVVLLAILQMLRMHRYTKLNLEMQQLSIVVPVKTTLLLTCNHTYTHKGAHTRTRIIFAHIYHNLRPAKLCYKEFIRDTRGVSICNENPCITPSINALGFYVICTTKDQSVALIMVYETLFHLSKLNKLQTF